jgi:hypothetical protein
VRNDHTPISVAPEVLGREKTQTAELPHRSGLPPALLGKNSLRGILDHRQIPFSRDIQHRVHLGAEAKQAARIYFTGGASAVLLGWRSSTVDVDIQIIPESDLILRAIPRLKEELGMNIEIACPADFIPEIPGWEDRSLFIATEGKISFYHYDFYAQALSKIERGHVQDLQDVHAMITRRLIEPQKIRQTFDQIEPFLYRYPAIHPPSFRQALNDILQGS